MTARSTIDRDRELRIVTTRHYSDEWTATESEWDLGMPQGSGKTEREAILDLLEQIERYE